jgi:CBS domain-containing membrane protein
MVGPSSALPILMALMAASAVLLFAVPASPLERPWAALGGNTLLH